MDAKQVADTRAEIERMLDRVNNAKDFSELHAAVTEFITVMDTKASVLGDSDLASLTREALARRGKPLEQVLMLGAMNAPPLYRIRVTRGHNAEGLFVSDMQGRLVPPTQLRLCLEQGEATAYFHQAATSRQAKLKQLGFTTELEEVPPGNL